MIVLRQRIAAGVAAGGFRQGEAQAAKQRGIGHVGTRFQVAAIGIGRLQVFQNRPDGFHRHQVRDRLVVLAPVAFECVCHGIETGVHGCARRNSTAEHRVYDGHFRHEDRVIDGLLLGLVADDGDLCHLAAGSGRCRNRDDGQALCREGLLPVIVVDGFPIAEGDSSGELRRVDGAAAADADDGVSPSLTGQAGGLDDTGELWVLLHAAEYGDNTAVIPLHLLRRRGKVSAAGDDAALQPEFFQDFTELCKLSLAEIDLDWLGIDKIMRHRSLPQSRPPWRQTCACWRHASLPDPDTSRWRGRS